MVIISAAHQRDITEIHDNISAELNKKQRAPPHQESNRAPPVKKYLENSTFDRCIWWLINRGFVTFSPDDKPMILKE